MVLLNGGHVFFTLLLLDICVQALAELRKGPEEIPIVIGGKRIKTGTTRDQLCVSH